MNDLPFLPYGRQSIDDDDVHAVQSALRSDYLTTGPAVAAFEAALSQLTKARYAVSCSSGTAALHLAALALGLGLDDRVVVPAITFLAGANAARYVGAEVVFADVDPVTGIMRPSDLEDALARANGPVAAAAPVHIGGASPDMAGISEIADKFDIAVIEDACHALGSETPVGDALEPAGSCRHSRAACFSFHPVKTVAMGEGGAVTTNDASFADAVSRLRNHGMVREPEAFVNHELAFDRKGRPNPWYYEMHEPGFNYRASDLHAALGASQLAKLPRFRAERRRIAALYDERLAGFASVVRRPPIPAGQSPCWHLYIVLIDFDVAGISRADLMRGLHERGIGSQVHYLPLHRQPYYARRYGEISLPGADAYYRRCLALPLFVGMTESDVDRVVDGLSAVIPALARG